MKIRWVEELTVLAIHGRQIAEHGGENGLRDKGLLLSALARPQNKHNYEPNSDLAELAAAYGYGLAKNHPFIDGNKRVALVVTRTFLGLNSHSINATQGEKSLIFLKLAEGSLNEKELAKWTRERLIKL
jgi:death on curing protein